mmetsp:Transcript_22554/g.42803  ORF Transcript_22554/g.42803 Transcript_22554/m.42803 type:complete len:301 (+) Transcript_22554:167-1069(+)
MRVLPLFRVSSSVQQVYHSAFTTSTNEKPPAPSPKLTRSRSTMKKPSPSADDPTSKPIRKEDMILLVDIPDQGRVLERVEVLVSVKKGNRVLKIICVPEGEQEHEFQDLYSVSSAEDSFLSESEYRPSQRPQQPTFLEQLASTVLDPCQCQTFLKPALRKDRTRPDLSTRSVSFDKVDIKEFPMTLGDHPSAVSGPPVALDWERIQRERCVLLDEYEASRSPRRNRKQLKLSLRDRKGELQKQFSAEQVNQAWREARAIREQRKETIQRGILMMLFDDMVETTTRKFHRMGESLTQSILW